MNLIIVDLRRNSGNYSQLVSITLLQIENILVSLFIIEQSKGMLMDQGIPLEKNLRIIL